MGSGTARKPRRRAQARTRAVGIFGGMIRLFHRALLHVSGQPVMREASSSSPWIRHFVYRTECLRTTWKLRLGAPALVVATLWLTSGWWTSAIGRSLVCDSTVERSDAILVENFVPDYLLFERARQLRQDGLAPRVLVPVWTGSGSSELNTVSLGFTDLMAKLSRVGDIETVPVHEVEPVTLNVARDVQRVLEREHVRSVIVVTPLFRSRRSALIYGATLGRAGIAVRYAPVQETRDPTTWTRSWHGIQDVLAQWLKLQYYRLVVLPFWAAPPESAAPIACLKIVRPCERGNGVSRWDARSGTLEVASTTWRGAAAP